jgi:hypothetical protein
MKRILLIVCSLSLGGTVLAQSTTGLHVYDTTGRVVGNYVPSIPCINPKGVPCNGLAVLGTPSTPVVLAVSSGGVYFPLVHQLNVPQFFHSSSDCSGARFVGDTGSSIDGFLPPVAIGTADIGGRSSKVIVPINPPLHLDMHSVETFDDDPLRTDFTQPGVCSAATGNPTAYFVVTVDTSVFGTPPFSVR